MISSLEDEGIWEDLSDLSGRRSEAPEERAYGHIDTCNVSDLGGFCLFGANFRSVE